MVATKDDAILVLNAGSSSVKFALYVLADGMPTLRCRGQASGLGERPVLSAKSADGDLLLDEGLPPEARQDAALARILDWLEQQLGGLRLIGAGHRIVHGGLDHAAPVRIDNTLLAELHELAPLAPLHQPHNLAAVEAVAALRPQLPQVACFDTAFHRRQPRVAQLYALPREYSERGILRYGFHGLSYEYIADQLPKVDPQARRTVVAHLGNGASLCAIEDGRSIASTMGFTALEGLPMGTRCGSIDPGVVLYLLQHDGLSANEVEQLLYKRSGLLGVSGLSGDMRRLLESDSAAAAEAVELYCYRAAREIASLVAALGGLDSLVFTAGIGENAAPIRARICAQLEWLGLRLDAEANRRHGPRISSEASSVRVWAIPTNEELMIARHTLRLLS